MKGYGIMAEAKNTILIGIAGGTGSGKTTLADKVVDSFGRDEVSILRHDNYYKRHDEMNYEDRSKLNYDHPDAFDTELLCEHIKELKKERRFRCRSMIIRSTIVPIRRS